MGLAFGFPPLRPRSDRILLRGLVRQGFREIRARCICDRDVSRLKALHRPRLFFIIMDYHGLSRMMITVRMKQSQHNSMRGRQRGDHLSHWQMQEQSVSLEGLPQVVWPRTPDTIRDRIFAVSSELRPAAACSVRACLIRQSCSRRDGSRLNKIIIAGVTGGQLSAQTLPHRQIPCTRGDDETRSRQTPTRDEAGRTNPEQHTRTGLGNSHVTFGWKSVMQEIMCGVLAGFGCECGSSCAGCAGKRAGRKSAGKCVARLWEKW